MPDILLHYIDLPQYVPPDLDLRDRVLDLKLAA